MSDAVVRRESASEYFKELVEGALANQRIAAGELTSFYVVNLLTGFLQRAADEDDAPLAFRLAEALDAAGYAPAHEPQTDRGSLAVHVGVLRRLLPAQARGRRLLREHRRHRLPAIEPIRDRYVFVSIRANLPTTSSASSTCCPRSANEPRAAPTPTCSASTNGG